MSDYHDTWDPDRPADAQGTDEPPPRPSFFSRLWMVFAQPADLFRALAANPAWFPMAAFGAAVTGVSMAVIPAEAFYEAMAANMAPEQLAGMRDVPIAWLKWPWVILGAGIVLVFPVILSLISYVIFVFMRGDRATFRQHLSVMAHAGVISAFGALLVTPIRISTMNAQEILAVGDLLPFLGGYVSKVLNLLDLFALWATMVAGLGLAVIDPRRRWGTTASVLVLMLLIVVMIQALFVP